MKGFAKQFKDLPDYILKITYQIWEDKDVEAIRDYYADTPTVSLPTPTRSPAGVIYGAEPVIEATYATLKLLISFLSDSSSCNSRSLVQHGLVYVGVPPLFAILSLYSGKSSRSAGALLSLSPEKPFIRSLS